MSRTLTRLPVAFMALALVAGAFQAQDAAPEPFSGRLEAAQATELKLELKNYGGELRLKSVLAPGAAVNADDVIAEVDAADYQRALERARENLALAEATLAAMQDAVDHQAASAPLALQKAQRDAERAAEALAYFQATEKQRTIRERELNLELSANRIQDTEEELAQLETLYKGNNLAKESQDIVLNRTRRGLAQSKERFEMQKKSHQRFLEVELPRQEADLVAAVEATKNELERVRRATEKGNIELTTRHLRARQGLEDARRALADLEADAGAFTLKAPHAGVVVVGGLAGNNGLGAGLKAGDKLSRGQAVASVVNPATLSLTFTFPAASRDRWNVGSMVKVKSADGTEAQGRVTGVGFLVDGRGRLSATVEVDNAEGKLLVGSRAMVEMGQ